MSDISMEDANVRIGTMFWLPGVSAAMSVPREFMDAMEDCIDTKGCAVSKYLGLREEMLGRDGEDYLIEALQGKAGFIFRAERPVYHFGKDGKVATYSWGHFSTAWLVAKTESDIPNVAVAWAEALRAKEQAKGAVS